MCTSSWELGLLVVVGLCASGCPGPPPEESSAPTAESGADDSGAAPASPAEVLLEPFDAPPLAELDSQVTWEDQPVVDSMERYREYKSGQNPALPASEALRLRNRSTEDNEALLSSLGQPWTSEAEVDFNATFNRHVYGDLKSTNPILISSTTSFDILGYTGVGLFGFDWRMEPFAAADYVVSWQSSSDRMYDKVVLREDMKWSDGRPMTAHDVAFSFRTIMDPRVPVPAVRAGTDQLRWVEAYDDRTLVFFHKEPLATNVWNINFPVLPRHIYEQSLQEDPTLENSEHHRKYEERPVVGGPYIISKRTKGQEIVLERRDDWFMHNGQQVRGRPHFKTIRFHVIEDSNTALLSIKKAEIDEIELQPEHWNTQTDDDDFYRHNTKVRGTQWVSFHLAWNCADPIFRDRRVRQAMSYAFDYEEMLQNLCYGVYEPCTGIYHHTAWMAPRTMPALYHQDLDKAEELLDEAGWTDSDGDGIRDKQINGRRQKLEFTILTSQRDLRIAVCTLLKECLDRIGVICHVKPTEFTVLEQLTSEHKFQAWMGGWGTGTDPDTSENLWKTGENRNYVQYQNPEVDRLYEEGKKEFDREKRAEIYRQIHLKLWEDQPYTWLYFQPALYGFNKKLRGYMISPRGPYHFGPGADAIYAVP
jgi:peptide/nickel transport system substrate-binding protein